MFSIVGLGKTEEDFRMRDMIMKSGYYPDTHRCHKCGAVLTEDKLSRVRLEGLVVNLCQGCSNLKDTPK